MEIELHIPTEQYGFILVKLLKATPGEVKDVYDEYAAVFKIGEGLTEKELDAFVEKQLLGESNHIDDYNKATPSQQREIQRVKRALKRIRGRQEKE